MQKLLLREPRLDDEANFLANSQKSQLLHQPWLKAPSTSSEFRAYLERYSLANQRSFLLETETRNLVGVFNLNEIVRGAFQSAYLAYYAMVDYIGQGYMRLGLKLVLEKAFTELELHRLEANIQPGNRASIALVKITGFRKEGFSLRYLKIEGEWCDHERWAITYEDWLNQR